MRLKRTHLEKVVHKFRSSVGFSCCLHYYPVEKRRGGLFRKEWQQRRERISMKFAFESIRSIKKQSFITCPQSATTNKISAFHILFAVHVVDVELKYTTVYIYAILKFTYRLQEIPVTKDWNLVALHLMHEVSQRDNAAFKNSVILIYISLKRLFLFIFEEPKARSHDYERVQFFSQIQSAANRRLFLMKTRKSS